ncbi:hypothetical protein RMATCC62417_04513 [Rhizopus microsporus]|nr:hypothetical protein RMATCC62417_04513 [Rhizopus microsporus]CEJ02455.1 hypothetical protein RMCBS344292_16460 [Rhizopus microsporus]
MTSDLMLPVDQNEPWTLLPSDPAIFNDMVREYGTKEVKVQEVYSLDFDFLNAEGPVYGLILASKCTDNDDDIIPTDTDIADINDSPVTFTAQVITNICGTLALLAVLFNADIYKGALLESFLEFTRGFSPVNRGMALGNSPQIRKIHHLYTTLQQKSDTLMMDIDDEELASSNQELVDTENYHYVSYIYKAGFVWELDGLKHGPVKLAPSTENDWLNTLKPFLEQKMTASEDNGIAFSLMAVTYESLTSKQDNEDIDNLIRQKFDYFPFLEKLFTIAYEEGLLQECAEFKKHVKAVKRQVASKKKSQKSKATKGKNKVKLTTEKPIEKKKRGRPSKSKSK